MSFYENKFSIYKKTISHKRHTVPSKHLNYTLHFKSLIAPFAVKKLKLAMSSPTSKKSGKILIKQSYMLLTWLLFISSNASRPGSSGKSFRPVFFIKPTKRSIFTTTKAPMAHKTFSQEQYKFNYYSITISFSLPLYHRAAPGLNEALYLANTLRSSNTFFETNLFFLSKINFNIPFKSSDFLKIM